MSAVGKEQWNALGANADYQPSTFLRQQSRSMSYAIWGERISGIRRTPVRNFVVNIITRVFWS